ncbi:MAG: phage holin family protein [Cyanobacteriota bacterium]|nr:phage holin family protein [Cyanobacteriota bacterium]
MTNIMDEPIALLIVWIVNAISLFLIAQLRPITGVEIDNFQKALWSAIMFGLLNVLIRPVLERLAVPLDEVFSTFIVGVILNMAIFGLAAWLVSGFRLQWGVLSALIGSLALGIINSVIYQIIGVT